MLVIGFLITSFGSVPINAAQHRQATDALVWPILILCGMSGAVDLVMTLLFCRARLMASRWAAEPGMTK